MLQSYEDEFMIVDADNGFYICTVYGSSTSTCKQIDSALKFDSLDLAKDMAKLLVKRGDLTDFGIVKRSCTVETVV
jgi:hypothetical protein